MAFRFPLDPLLRLRQSIERQRALRLREASLEVARMQDSLQQLDRFLAESAESDQAALGAGRRGAEIQFASHYRDNLHELREAMRGQLRELERKRLQAAVEYQQAYREREALDMLRTRHHRAYQQDAMRREQRELDAAHLLQLWRNRSG